MLTRDTCRRLLGARGQHLSDAELDNLTGGMYVLARFAVAEYSSTADLRARERDPLSRLDCESREQVEERAAMLEFDGNMSRDAATRTALHQFVRERRGVSGAEQA